MVMSDVPEVVVEHYNGVEEQASVTDAAEQNGDDGYAKLSPSYEYN